MAEQTLVVPSPLTGRYQLDTDAGRLTRAERVARGTIASGRITAENGL